MTDLVFDPGVTTGVALLDETHVIWTKTFVQLLDVGNIVDLARMTSHVYRIIYEEYVIFQGKRNAHINSRVYPAQVIGAIRYLAYLHQIPLIPLAPRVKSFVPKDVFASWRPEGKLTEHEKDAIKLGLYQHLLDKNA